MVSQETQEWREDNERRRQEIGEAARKLSSVVRPSNGLVEVTHGRMNP